jgi:ComF family protein
MYISPIERFINALTREECLICNLEEGPICRTCFDEVAEDIDSRCYKCNKITKQNRVCSSCRSRLRRVWWAGIYDGELKEVITKMKLGRKRTVARQVGSYFSDLLPYFDADTLIVPVPTAQTRVRRRGFDHAVVLAQHLADTKGLAYQSVLTRTNNADQIGKRRTERIQQMKNSFVIKRNANIEGRSVVLIDDVLTTGATLEAAATLLRKHGAKHVDAVVIARHLLK